jgi:KDO2-lipid IV(A) lauroyltransferase
MLRSRSVLLKIKHVIEVALVLPLYLFLLILPFKYSSLLVGKLLRLFGRFHRSHQTALKNLSACFPEKTPVEIEKIALNSWENLGRVAGELPHISSYTDSKMQELCPISGIDNVDTAAKLALENKTGFILVSAHIGNWEAASRMLLVLDPQTALIYRKANNPYVESLIQKIRGNYTSFIIPKGDRTGVRDIVKHLKSGGRLGMLADQKLNEGVEVEFFGRKVNAPAAAGEMAIKYNMPIVMGRVIRDEKTKVNFVLRFEEPIYPAGKAEREITQKIYDTYERWIREYPNQWFWQHNRFDLAE